MSYEYTDADRARLNVDGYATNINVYATDRGQSIGVLIPHDDAPAVALAILEAAGVEPKDRDPYTQPYTEEQWAVLKLRELADKRAERAAREAEDAKVREWWNATEYGYTTGTSWDDLGASARIPVRQRYRRHLAHFTGADG